MEKIKENDGYLPPLEPTFVQRLMGNIVKYKDMFTVKQATSVVLTSPAVGRFVKKVIEPYAPNVAVISYSEVDPGAKVNVIGTVGD